MAYEAKKADSMRLRDQENILEELTQEVKQLRAEVENMAYEAKKADSMSPVDIIEPTNKELQNTQPGANFTQAELLRIAKDILSEWDLIALRTGLFDHDEITNIRQNNSYTDDVRKAMAMLDAYQKRNGTRECLVLALEESQRHDTARKVRSKCYQTIKAD
ncbi:uncharacterized protein LOC114532959 [Dendronephthya gigantea]|uniref:uncharacterized protein LOC114532959 n=1 Tax=Dendronephthya gigantea TaxID=151771 RepID=UPI00106B21F0|nr:uncharacterized protein LOC114532959 [Dendronephthya gigantea]